MKLLRLVVATCVFTAVMLSHPANAALIDADWKNLDDNFLTADTESGLRWLDLTVTAGMSRDEVRAETGAGGMFEGFRYATASEVIHLWAQYGISLTPTTRITTRTLDPNIITASQQLGNVYGLAIEASDYGTLGLIEIDASLLRETSGWSGAFRETGKSYYEGPTIDSIADNVGKEWLGSYMVTTVPVPGAVWLFASGLLGLAGFACRKT